MTDLQPVPEAATPFLVVGVSRSGSAQALRWAADEARRREARLVAVRAWRPASGPGTSGSHPSLTTYDAAQDEADARSALQQDVAAALGEDPEREHGIVAGVECRLVHGGRRKVLVAQARGAELLVIDAPRRTDLSVGPMFAQRLVHTAPCPVVVMPPDVAGAGPTPLARAGRQLAENVVRAAATAGRPGVRPPSTGG